MPNDECHDRPSSREWEEPQRHCPVGRPRPASSATVPGHWLLPIGHWPLAIGYWLLAIGYWSLAVKVVRSHLSMAVGRVSEECECLLTSVHSRAMWTSITVL